MENIKKKDLIGKTVAAIITEYNVTEEEVFEYTSDNEIAICDSCKELEYTNSVRYEGWDFTIKNPDIAKQYDSSCICDCCIEKFEVDFI